MSASNITEAEWNQRIDLAAAFHLAVANNLHEAIANHLSAVLPDGQHFLVNRFGLHFSEITASNLIVCDFSGKVIRGEGEPSASAHHIHAPIHLKNGFWIMPVAYIGADG